MAFGANYGYNPYVNPYANPYGNQQMQPQMYQQQMPQQMQTPQLQQQSTGGFVWVNNIDEAAAYIVAPNSAVQLWDKNSPCVYLKTADAAGKPTMQIFDLVERKTAQNGAQQISDSNSDFIRREEFDALAARVDALTAKKQAKVKVKEENEDA